MLTDFILLFGGLALLLVCGDALVRGAVALSVKFNVPTLVIGLTVVAFGTSAPELVVSVHAAVSGAPGLAVGNVVGSNIANIFLVLGVPALISAIDCNQPFIRRNMIFVLIASLVFIGLSYVGPLSFVHGLVLVILLIAFLLESARRAQAQKDAATVLGEEAIETIDGIKGLPFRPYLIAFMILIGIIGMPVGAHLTVVGATHLARDFGVSDAVIGLTLVALGTSLPELATTTIAAFRNQAGLALGNVLGSNLFNLLAIMGFTALIAPLPIPPVFFQIDLWVMLAASAILALFVLPRAKITRLPALLFVGAYLAYIYFVFAPRATDSVAAQGGVVPGLTG